MAQGTTKVDDAYTTYDATSNREDLSDIIYNLDPFETPIVTVAGRRNVNNTLFEWQTESLPTIDTTADVEGFELDREASTPTVRQSNVAQIKHRDATVSRTQNKANPAGKRKEMAHQLALVGKALKRDIETVIFGTLQTLVSGNATTPRQTRAFINWIETNTVFENGNGGADPIVSSNTAAVDDGTPAAFTEDNLNDAMELAWNNGGEPKIAFMGSFNKRVASGFDGRSSARQNIAWNKVVNSVTLYATDFGDIKLMPSRHMRGRDIFIIDPRHVKIAYYDNFTRSKMAKTGDAETEMITVEFGTQVDNELAHAVIRDRTSS